MSDVPRSGVIHDLGYRHYDGRRDGTGTIALTLFTTGLRHVYGLGRSGKSKILPFLLLGMSALPALIVVGVVVLTGLSELPITYAGYVNQTQLLISLFAAAQAPVLFSRDLRHRSIVLYLARPLSAPVFAITRWLSLTVVDPGSSPRSRRCCSSSAPCSPVSTSATRRPSLLKALCLQVLLATMLAGITGLISSVSLRRGFAVVGSVMALIVLSGVVTAVQGISDAEDSDGIGVVAGLFSPWSLHSGLADAWDAGVSVFTPPDGAWVLAYVLVGLLIAAACGLGLVARFQKVGAR